MALKKALWMATNRAPQRKRDAQPAGEPTSRLRREAKARGPKAVATDRRSEILQVATRRFAQFGFEATTVRQIADDLSLLSGSLYHHFSTKDEMLHEIVRDAVLQMRDNTIRIAKAPLDAEHKLVALILLDLGELTRNQSVHAILHNERKLFRRSEEFAYVVQAKKAAYVAWQSVLRDGMKAKLFKPDIDLYLTIATILRMLNTAADWYRNESESGLGVVAAYTLDQVIDFHLDFALSAVRAHARIGEAIPRAACQELARFRV